jgi:hypothetical protein
MTNLSRAIVLFIFVGDLAALVYYDWPAISPVPMFLLILDSIGFIFLLMSRDLLKQIGYVWAGLMSILLIQYIFPYFGNGTFFPDVTAIILLSSIQLLVLLKIGIDTYVSVSQDDVATQ